MMTHLLAAPVKMTTMKPIASVTSDVLLSYLSFRNHRYSTEYWRTTGHLYSRHICFGYDLVDLVSDGPIQLDGFYTLIWRNTLN